MKNDNFPLVTSPCISHISNFQGFFINLSDLTSVVDHVKDHQIDAINKNEKVIKGQGVEY